MERLTSRIKDKVYYSKGKYPPTTICAEMENWEVRECMNKLAEYEDTGAEPNQIITHLESLRRQSNTIIKLGEELEKTEAERDFWEREAIESKAQLGEIRILAGTVN